MNGPTLHQTHNSLLRIPDHILLQFGLHLPLDGSNAIMMQAFTFQKTKLVHDGKGEGFNLLHAMQTLWIRGYRQLTFERDSQQLVHFIRSWPNKEHSIR